MPKSERKRKELQDKLVKDAKSCKTMTSFFSKPEETRTAKPREISLPSDNEDLGASCSYLSPVTSPLMSSTSVEFVESSEESSIEEPEVADDQYWLNRSMQQINQEMDSDSTDDDSYSQNPFNPIIGAVKSDKRLCGSTSYEKDHSWLYFSHHHHGWMCKICEKYPHSSGPSRGAFSTRPCVNMTHPTKAFKQHANSKRHQRLEEKLMKAVTQGEDRNVLDQIIIGAEKCRKSQIEINRLYMQKCIHTVFFITNRQIALTDNYQSMLEFISGKLQEPIVSQYLNTCPKNATYKSNTSVESILDAMNFYFESNNLKDISESDYFSLCADESENSSHKECFSMFITYYSKKDEIVKTKFLGIIQLNGLHAAEIMDTLKKFCDATCISLSKVMFSVLDGTNTMSGKDKGLQRRIRNESPFNIYINCRNHRLALCFPHLMKKPQFKEMLVDFDALPLGLWKTFRYSPKRGNVFENVQMAYQKKTLKILKACTTRWLSHGLACKRVLDRLQEVLSTLDHICEEAFEADLRGYRSILSIHKNIYTFCLMTDILGVVNTLSIYLQKPERKFTDIKLILDEVLSTFNKLAKSQSHVEFAKILGKQCYYVAKSYIKLLNEYESTSKVLRSSTKQKSLENYHCEFAIPLVLALITEIGEAFQTKDFPILDTFHVIDPRFIKNFTIYESQKCHLDIIYEWYSENKIDIFDTCRKEASAILRCTRKTFHDEYHEYANLIRKHIQLSKDIDNELVNAKRELSILQSRKKARSKDIKASENKVQQLKQKMIQPVSVEDAMNLSMELFPNICTILQIILICPASGAVVERGFSVMNLAMNKLQSSMKITTLDAIMRLYHEKDLSDIQADDIVEVWKKRGDRRIEL